MTARALIAIADGSQDLETITLLDVLRRAGVEVVLASIESRRMVTLALGTRLTADAMLVDVLAQDFDLIALPGQWHACLSAIARHAAETDAHTIDIKLMALDGRRRQMWRAGFFERDSKPFLVVIPVDGDRRFVDPLRWFYCGADSDLDSLE